MAISTAISVASFSAVLAQSFVAVAASTMVPATFLSVLRAIKAKFGADGLATTESDAAAEQLVPMLSAAPGSEAILNALRSGVGGITDIDLLVPKTARIQGEFTFEASERYSADLAGGAVVNVVAVAAAYSALYSTRSTNKITLDVEFVAVNYTI